MHDVDEPPIRVHKSRGTVPRVDKRGVICGIAFLALTTLSGCSDRPRPAEPTPANVSTPSATASVDAAAKRAEELRDYAKLLGLNPAPVVTPERSVSIDEQPTVFASCMRDAGYTVGEDGTYSVPKSQTSALHVALYTCTARYPLEDRYYQPYTVEQKRIIYDYFAQELVPCLREAGYTPENPPTFETFLATAGTADEYNPYVYVPSLADQEMRELQKRCPAMPPNSRLWK